MTESTFKTRLSSILKDNAIERYVGNKKKGKVNTKRLYKISSSVKIFKAKEERKGKDYSISFLLDASGSMSSDQSKVNQAMAHIGNALNKTDIPFSIYSFSEVTRLIKGFNEKYDEKTVSHLYRKTFGLIFLKCYNCKQFDVPTPEGFDPYKYYGWGDNAPVFKCSGCGQELNRDSNGGTNDALALHIVGDEVHKVNKKNILIVITDGSGDNLEGDEWSYGKVKLHNLKNNKTVIRQLHKKYDDLILLGISVRGSYTKNVYGAQYSKDIKTPEQIFEAVAQLLNKHIKRG